MTKFSFDYFGKTIVVEAPVAISQEIAFFFHIDGTRVSDIPPTLTITENSAAGWELSGKDGTGVLRSKDKAGLMINFIQALQKTLPHGSQEFLSASGVGWDGSTALVLGAELKFCTLLTAWLVDNGFSYHAGGTVELQDETGQIRGFPTPFVLPSDIVSDVSALNSFREIPSLSGSDGVVAMARAEWLAQSHTALANLFVRPNFVPNAALSIRLLTADEAYWIFTEARLSQNGKEPAEDMRIQQLAGSKPFIEVTCGSLDQLGGALDNLVRFVCENKIDRDNFAKLADSLTPFPGPLASTPIVERSKVFEVQPRTDRRNKAKLTIGMATYDDYDGVYFSIQALRMYHADVMDQVELMIVDNHPDGPCGLALKQLDSKAGNLRYIPMGNRSGTSVKNVVFEEASGEYVLCMDCHVFLVPGAIMRLLEYFDTNPRTCDLLQGPLVPDELDSVITHWEPKWRGGMFGIWAASMKSNNLKDEPFDIPLMGMGLFACRKDAWPGFNPRFRGFGAEEGYIHEKFRQAGHRTLCLPFLGWMHRFNRPGGIPYRNRWQDRICNYLIGWQELGLPVDEMLVHMREIVGPQCVDEALAELRAEDELISSQLSAP